MAPNKTEYKEMITKVARRVSAVKLFIFGHNDASLDLLFEADSPFEHLAIEVRWVE